MIDYRAIAEQLFTQTEIPSVRRVEHKLRDNFSEYRETPLRELQPIIDGVHAAQQSRRSELAAQY